MITKSIKINGLEHSFGILKIQLGLNSLSLDDLLKIIEDIQKEKKGSMIQFFNERLCSAIIAAIPVWGGETCICYC